MERYTGVSPRNCMIQAASPPLYVNRRQTTARAREVMTRFSPFEWVRPFATVRRARKVPALSLSLSLPLSVVRRFVTFLPCCFGTPTGACGAPNDVLLSCGGLYGWLQHAGLGQTKTRCAKVHVRAKSCLDMPWYPQEREVQRPWANCFPR